MIEKWTGWIAPLGLGGLTLLIVLGASMASGTGRPTRQAALEDCRAEATRGLFITNRSMGPRTFEACMESKGF
jgi:hypothetical protein